MGAAISERGEGARHRHGSFARSYCKHPGDRERAKAMWERPKGRGGAAVGPREVVEADHERRLHRGPLEERLDVVEDPVALLGRADELRELRKIHEGHISAADRIHQRGEFDDFLALPACTEPGSKTQSFRYRPRLRQKPGLADSRLALDQGHVADAPSHPIERGVDSLYAAVSAAHRVQMRHRDLVLRVYDARHAPNRTLPACGDQVTVGNISMVTLGLHRRA